LRPCENPLALPQLAPPPSPLVWTTPLSHKTAPQTLRIVNPGIVKSLSSTQLPLPSPLHPEASCHVFQFLTRAELLSIPSTVWLRAEHHPLLVFFSYNRFLQAGSCNTYPLTGVFVGSSPQSPPLVVFLPPEKRMVFFLN